MNTDHSTKDSMFEMILDAVGNEPSTIETVVSDKTPQEDWRIEHQDGQLSVDVMETVDELIIVSTMAGADTEKIKVYIHTDLLTIRGSRISPSVPLSILHVFHEECFWGNFSRTIVLPVDVIGELSSAEYKNGILTVRIPKREQNDGSIPITIVE